MPRQDFSNELVKVTWLSSDLLSTETTQLVALNSQLLVGHQPAGSGIVDLVMHLIVCVLRNQTLVHGSTTEVYVKFPLLGIFFVIKNAS